MTDKGTFTTSRAGGISAVVSDLLNRLGIRDRWDPVRSNLTRIYDDDIFLVSVPRSGSNWTRLLLAQLIAPDQDFNFNTVDEIIPSLHSPRFVDADAVPRPRIIKTHFASYRRYPRFIYLVRDPRDVMVSWYHFLISIGQIDKKYSFSQFIRSSKARWPLDWSRHAARALDIAEHQPDRVLVVKYERLRANPHCELKQMAVFCALDASDTAIDHSIQKCQLHQLQAMENAHKPTPEFRGRFFRSGQSGQWHDWFDQKDCSSA